MSAAVEVRGLSFHFEEGAAALSEISFAVPEGESLAIVGPNGAGKSTLLLHVAGVLPDDGAGHGTGEVLVFGEQLHSGASAAIRRQVGLLFQDPDDQLFCPTVAEDVAYGARQLGLAPEELDRRVEAALARVGLAGLGKRAPHRLSGGEKKRAALAGLLVYEPRVLVFDEPTAGLDPRGRRELIAILRELSVTGLFATHDLALVAETCARTIVLDGGKIVADGPTRDLLLDDELMLAHGLERPQHDGALRFPSREGAP